MWEKIAVSGVLVAGAFALFLVFTLLLFLMERKNDSAHKQKKQPAMLRVIRYENGDRAA